MMIRWLPVLLLALGGVVGADDSGRYMPLSEVKPGMTGVCRTVLAGVQVESIPVEVVGVMDDVRPGQAMILVRLKGAAIEKSGVAQGMSGSPVYVDGRIIGALAYGWPGSMEALAGLTPIEDMLKLGSGDQASAGSEKVEMKATTVNPRADVGMWFREVGQETGAGRDRQLNRLAVPLCVSGFTTEGLARLRERVSGGNWSVVQGAGISGVSGVARDVRLGPGSSICVEVIRGDLNAYGVGTVTDVIGDRVLAMGHPMMNEGAMNLVMSTGYVQTIVPRRDISFKLASPMRPVGTVTLDQTVGVMGRLGKVPVLVPVKITLHQTDGSGPRTFNFRQTDDEKLMLALLSAATESCLTSKGRPDEEATVTLRTRIELEGQRVLETRNVYAGPKAMDESMRDVVNPVGFIVHNPFERPRFKSIEIEATVGKGMGRAAIAEMALPRRSYKAGETVEVLVTIMPVRTERTKVRMEMKLPKDLKPGSYSLLLCDADTEMQIDAGERPYLYEARTLEQVVDILGRPSPRDRLVLRMSAVGQGVSVGERAFGRVPESVLSILGGQMRSDVGSFTDPLREEKEMPYVIVGTQRTQIEVLPPEGEGTSQEDNE